MKEYIKILDDLRPEEHKFKLDPFVPINKNICYGGSPPPDPVKTVKKVVKKVQTTTGDAVDAAKENVHDAADAAKTNIHTAADATKTGVHTATSAARTAVHTATDAGRAFAHEAADTVKAGMQKIGLHKKDEDGEDTSEATAVPGESETVGESSGSIAMKEAVESKGKKAKTGAKGKRALRKVGAVAP